MARPPSQGSATLSRLFLVSLVAHAVLAGSASPARTQVSLASLPSKPCQPAGVRAHTCTASLEQRPMHHDSGRFPAVHSSWSFII